MPSLVMMEAVLRKWKGLQRCALQELGAQGQVGSSRDVIVGLSGHLLWAGWQHG